MGYNNYGIFKNIKKCKTYLHAKKSYYKILYNESICASVSTRVIISQQPSSPIDTLIFYSLGFKEQCALHYELMTEVTSR